MNPPLPALEASMLASSQYVLDTLRTSAAHHKLLDKLLLIAVTQTNVQSVTSSAAHQSSFAGIDEVPPMELRRPVSISALCSMLGLPFETVRRRTRRLVTMGDCRTVPGGLIVPIEALAGREHRKALRSNYDLVRALYLALRRADFVPSTTSHGVSKLQRPPVRAVARLSYDHLLRFVEAVRPIGDDLIGSLILLTVWRENVRGSPGDDPLRLADSRRRPLNAGRLADRLGLSESTVRRRLRKEEREGRIAISRRGALVPSRYLQGRGFAKAMKLNHLSLIRLTDSLARLGT